MQRRKMLKVPVIGAFTLGTGENSLDGAQVLA